MAFTMQIPTISKLLLIPTSPGLGNPVVRSLNSLCGARTSKGEKNNSMQIRKSKKPTALETFLPFHISIPHGPLRRQAKVVSLGLGIPAVGRVEVHRHLSTWTGQKEPPGRDYSTSLGWIRSKNDTCF